MFIKRLVTLDLAGLVSQAAVGSNVEEQEEGDDNGQPMAVQSGSSEASSTQMHVADVDKVEV